MNNRKPPKPIPKPHAKAPDPEAEWWAEEANRKNEMGAMAEKLGYQVDTDPGKPGAEDAVAHLESLPPDLAIKKAREWTGDQSIKTMDEAVAAVKEALSGNE